MDAEDPVAELFGRWQTEQYIPPPAHDVSKGVLQTPHLPGDWIQ